MEDGRGTYSVLVGTADERRPLGRLRSGWENNITMILVINQLNAQIIVL